MESKCKHKYTVTEFIDINKTHKVKRVMECFDCGEELDSSIVKKKSIPKSYLPLYERGGISE